VEVHDLRAECERLTDDVINFIVDKLCKFDTPTLTCRSQRPMSASRINVAAVCAATVDTTYTLTPGATNSMYDPSRHGSSRKTKLDTQGSPAIRCTII
jgi:hypothetical protein